MKIIKPYFLILILLSSCTFEENVKFEQIKNVKLVGVKDGMLNLIAEADFYNPNDVSGKLKSIDLEVLLKDKSLARITQTKNFKIDKNAKFTIPINVSFAMADIQNGFLDNLLTIVSGKKLLIQFKGEIKVSTWGFTQTVPVNYYEEVRL
jgi:LEA14-like dessication related protein